MGELTKSNHVMKACNVYLGENKDKLLIVLFSSKTHHEGSRPQQIKITANAAEKSGMYRKKNFCPLMLISAYLQVHSKYLNDDEQFFIFRDSTPVSTKDARDVLRKTIRDMGLDDWKYSMHSLHIGQTSDLIKFGYSIEEVMHMGRWKSNTVFRYIRN